ncbi:MAG: sortase, partial [Caldilineaceae bacterium]|nr:sortase [Caldilineaceae bacterium]
MSRIDAMKVRSILFWAIVMFLLVSCNRAKGEAAPNAVSEGAQANTQPALPKQEGALPPLAGHGLLPDRLVIPAINLDIPVVELGWRKNTAASGDIFSEWDVAEYAAGWHKNSAPLENTTINGGNVVMSGHNNILGSVFRELDQLKRNDEITVWSGAQRVLYQVDKVLIVPEKYATEEQRLANAAWIGPSPDARLTLVSCWPRDDNTHRIIVVAHPQP